ncbi:MAG: hypothetical protein GHCLOJNM_03241 [bacterium]|nr:hypothetical protein [bacterium]
MMIDRKQAYMEEAARNRNTLDFRPFPIESLPEPIRSYVHSGAEALGCDPSLIALPLLSSVGGIIGNKRWLRLKATWEEPPNLWTVTIGESGELKTPALRLALEPIQTIQDRLFAVHAQAMEVFQDELSAWESSPRKDRGVKPIPPPCARVACSDVTMESLALLLCENPNGLLVWRDELSGWVGSFNQYRKGAGGDEGHWLFFWSGGALTVDRKSGERKTIHVRRACASITGSIQPGTLRRALGTEHLEDGMAARFLMAMPPSRPKVWNDNTIGEAVRARMRETFEALGSLRGGEDWDPVRVSLSPDAQEVWIDFFESHDLEARTLTGPLRSAFAKLEAYAARLALVVHTVRSVSGHRPPENPFEVDPDSMRSGITLARWFAGEARRVYALLGIADPGRAEQRNLVTLIEDRGGRITANDLRRFSWRFKNDPEGAEAALAGLVSEGLGTWDHRGGSDRGGRPSSVFVLTDLYSTKPSESNGNGRFRRVEADEEGKLS